MIEIAPFAPRHQRGVVAVILPIQREEFGIDISLEAQPDLLDIPAYYQHGAGNFWVAIDDDDVIGTIALLDIGNHQGALRKMFVKATHRGRERGVAGRLLDTLLRAGSEQGVREIFLGTTDKFLAAHRFYEKHRFATIEKAALPLQFPVMSVDTRFYRRILS